MATERMRDPAPLLGRRVPSGRGAMEQPNNTGDGDARLSGPFWIATVISGALAGVAGVTMMLVLHGVQHLAFGYHDGFFGDAVARASEGRRLVALVLGGAVVGPGWYLLRRYARGSTDVDDAVWSGSGDLAMLRSAGSATLSEIAVGVGASIGREAAPKLIAAAFASRVARAASLTGPQRRLLVACAGGAGLAAVYNVPLGGALLTAEVMIGQLTLPVVLPALVCCATATVVGWVYLPQVATYENVPQLSFSWPQLPFGLLAGLVLGVAAVGFVRLIAWISHVQLRGRAVIVGPVVAFGILGLVAWRLPALLGNGRDMTRIALLDPTHVAVLTVVALLLLKPVVTAMCLGSGAAGGLFTPVLATGAVGGLLLGLGWQQVWSGSSLTAYVVIGAAAFLAAAMQAPLAGTVLVAELTRSVEGIAVPMVLAVAVATLVVRYVDGYSIYSARLPYREMG